MAIFKQRYHLVNQRSRDIRKAFVEQGLKVASQRKRPEQKDEALVSTLIADRFI